MPKIVLSTLNARYIHSALGLRYLAANMGELQDETVIREFTLESRPEEVVELLLSERPAIIGLGVYIWNVEQTTRLAALIKSITPQVTVVVGGPEVSHEWQSQSIADWADYVVSGPGDLVFAPLCRKILAGDAPSEKVIVASFPDLKEISLPYTLYNDEDVANRVIYVEASRGCPFKCEFCLSALDKTSYVFDLEAFLEQMSMLYQRGVRHFKFVDRTFNLDVTSSSAILEFFLGRMDERLFLHFEVIPDRLPERLKVLLQRFPEGSLQLEVGIQSFNPEVQTHISRRQDNDKSRTNLHWLRNSTHAHLHTDLIIGLPGEDMASFARGFDELVSLKPHEIQVGVLKRLRGTPIIRHTDAFDIHYNPHPPYEVLSTNSIDFKTMQRLKRFARYWDMIANSGRFLSTLPLILERRPFERFMELSDWLYEATGQLSRISLKRLFELLYQGLTANWGLETGQVTAVLLEDYGRSGIKGSLSFQRKAVSGDRKAIVKGRGSRQEVHIRGNVGD